MLTCCKLGALDFIILLRFHSNRIIQTRIFLYVCKTPASVAAAPAEPAAATPPPQRPPPPRPSPPWSPPPRPPPPRKRAAVAATSLRPPHPKFKPAYFVRVSRRKFKMIFKFDFLGCQHWNEQLRFFKILEYTGRYGFPEILIEVRSAFLELALRKNPRRILAESSPKAKKKLRTVSE